MNVILSLECENVLTRSSFQIYMQQNLKEQQLRIITD